MPLTPEEFERAWGADALVRLPAELATAPIPSDVRDFLVRAGLPGLIFIYGGPTSTDVKITFCRLASGVSPVLSEPIVGGELPTDWSVYWVLGDEFFCNGAAWWCVHERTGQVARIDIELDSPIDFANSSVAHFASAVLAVLHWSASSNRSPEKWPSEVDRLKRELTTLDPASMGSDRNFWPSYLGFIREEGLHLGAFEKGSRLEGERALQDGPW